MPAAMLVEVVILARGTAATTSVAAGGTVINVENTTQFDDDGGRLDIVGAELARRRAGESGAFEERAAEAALLAETFERPVEGNAEAVH